MGEPREGAALLLGALLFSSLARVRDNLVMTIDKRGLVLGPPLAGRLSCVEILILCCAPLLCNLLLHQRQPQHNVEPYQRKRHGKHRIVPTPRIHDATQKWRHQNGDAHAQRDIAHDSADLFLAHGIDKQRQTDCPNHSSRKPLQKASSHENAD